MRNVAILLAIIVSVATVSLATAILTNYKIWQWLAQVIADAGNNWQGLAVANMAIITTILCYHLPQLLPMLMLSIAMATAAAVVRWVLWQLSELTNYLMTKI